jgi:hypothetical protein
MAGLPPYKPFENDRVKWTPPKSESGAPLLADRAKEDFSFRQPAILVFLAGTDGANCCAANYERIVFMDKKVVDLTKKIPTLRINRSSADAKLLKRYGVKKGKPAIRVLDCEGVVHARFDLCTNARDVFKAMLSCLKASKTKVKQSKKIRKLLDKADTELKGSHVREAAKLFRRVMKVKGAPAAGVERAARILGELELEGARLLKEAMGFKKPVERFDRLMKLRHEFWDFEGIVTQVRPQIRKLELDPKTKEVVHNHKGILQIEEALALIKKGGKLAKKGRSALRKVRFEWKGYPAAERAEDELAKAK